MQAGLDYVNFGTYRWPAFKPLPKVTIARYSSPVRGRAPYLVGCVAEIAIGLVRCLYTHAQLRIARFRNWCRGEHFKWRGRQSHVFFDEIPARHRDEETDQLRAPYFQRQSGRQDGNQYRAPVLRGLFLHNCYSNPKFNTLARTARQNGLAH